MTAYFHNIGQPEHYASWQSLWDSLRENGVITAGFGNHAAGRGYEVLNRYEVGDIIFAYANSFGVVGYGIAEGRETYRLTKQAKHGSNHRHEIAIDWQSAALDIEDGLRPAAVRQITHHLPRQTSEKVFSGAEDLRAALDHLWRRPLIGRPHVLSAFEQIGEEGYPDQNESTVWDVIEPETGRRFPPKVILKRAAELAGLIERGRNYRGGGWPTNDILRALEFVVVPKEGQTLRAEQEFAELRVDELRRRAERDANPQPRRTPIVGSSIPRSAAISAYAKRLAGGQCDLCDDPAPFQTKAGPFLECHHIHRLADGGPDCIENVVALCPNCHRRMHLAPLEADKERLLRRVVERESKRT
jgi:5-methylcytosine-specific restriction endonuclease McrA